VRIVAIDSTRDMTDETAAALTVKKKR